MVDSRVVAQLRAIHGVIVTHPLALDELRERVAALLAFLASSDGRTDANCRAVDLTIMDDDDLWDRIDEIETADPTLANVLRDMAGALHDAVSAPDVAANFESTPELLLGRLQAGRS